MFKHTTDHVFFRFACARQTHIRGSVFQPLQLVLALNRVELQSSVGTCSLLGKWMKAEFGNGKRREPSPPFTFFNLHRVRNHPPINDAKLRQAKDRIHEPSAVDLAPTNRLPNNFSCRGSDRVPVASSSYL